MVCIMYLLCVLLVVPCGSWLFTGPPSALDYVLSYLFSFN